MKFTVLFLIKILVILFIVIDVNAVTIENAGFENDQGEWIKTASSVTYTIQDGHAHEASHSAEILYSSSSTQGIKQSIPDIEADTSYKITGFIKTMNETEKALMRIAWYQEGNNSQLKTEDSPSLSGSTDWSPIEFIVTAPSNATSAELRLLVSEGQAYYDDILIEEYVLETLIPTTEPTEPPLNPTVYEAFSESIYISEVLAYPDAGQSEWVELYNDADIPVDLSDWYIDDGEESGSLPKQISLTIAPKSYEVITLTSAMFNNDGDMVRLLNQDKIEVDSINYVNSKKNISFGRNDIRNRSTCLQNPSEGSVNSECISMIAATPTTKPTTTVSPTKKPLLSPTQEKTTPTKTPTIQQPERYFSQTQISDKNDDAVPEVLGLVDLQTPQKKPNKAIPFLAFSYSLLSLVSISVKMIIT